MIAFTNHALDHLLTSVLDAGITDKIVRLGSRSADERISQYSIENLEIASPNSSRLKKESRVLRRLKSIQEEVTALMGKITRKDVLSADIADFLENQYPEHYEHTINPPAWIKALQVLWGVSEQEGEWKTVDKRGAVSHTDHSPYARWLRGEDLDFLANRPDLPPEDTPSEEDFSSQNLANRYAALSLNATEEKFTSSSCDSAEGSGDDEEDLSEADSDDSDEADWQRIEHANIKIATSPVRVASPALFELGPNTPEEARPLEASQEKDDGKLDLSDFKDPLAFFAAHSMDSIPEIPTTNRTLDTLLAEGQMWTLSQMERQKLDQYWRDRTRERMYHGHLLEFQDLREKHTQTLKMFNEEKNEVSYRQSFQGVKC